MNLINRNQKENPCGRFISSLRHEKGWTQADLAKRIGVTDKAVSRWETGKGYPDVTIISHLAEVLDVSVSELLSGERIAQESRQDQAERLLLRNLRSGRDRMTGVAAMLLILSIMLVILGMNLWRSFGWGSDAFRGFHQVMAEGGFGMMSQILVILIPLVMAFLSGYLLSIGSREERKQEDIERGAHGREERECEEHEHGERECDAGECDDHDGDRSPTVK